MPLRQLIEDDEACQVLSPEELVAIIGAYEDTLGALKLTNREDPLTLRVARCILDLAKSGERDPATKLQQRTLASIRK